MLPGTVVAAEGNGFGEKPGIIVVGETNITEIVHWQNDVVFFRIPETGLLDRGRVEINGIVATDTLRPAPEGAIRVRWKITQAGFDNMVETQWKKVYNAPSKPELRGALYLKGEWVKAGEYSGNYEPRWDGGPKVRMLWDEKEMAWTSEMVFTPDNRASFSGRMIKFAFDDDNKSQRNLSAYESNIAFMLKSDWAKTDLFPTSYANPAFQLSFYHPYFNTEKDEIQLYYPLP